MNILQLTRTHKLGKYYSIYENIAINLILKN